MENVMKIAIETYAKLTNTSFDKIVSDCQNGNIVVIENVQKLMFSVV